MAWILALLACFDDPEPVASDPCTDCHGDPATGPAPPVALGGFTDPSHLGVGAHEAHVFGTRLQSPVACSECHQWPDSVDAEGHTDTPWPAEVRWGEIGATGGGSAPWDREAATCTVYCHGATLAGGLLTAPEWTATDGAASQCGACHGNPPPPPHPQGAVCAECHGQTTPDTHIDGRVQCWTEAATTDGTTGATATGTSAEEGSCDDLPCALCHGTADSAAPPPGVLGQTDPSDRGVGAHATHLAGTALSAPVGCWTCHVEITGVLDPGHIDPSPAEVVLSGTAAAGGVTPAWDPAALTCETWCHGSTALGGTNPTPVWTSVGAGAAGCGACHALPPPAPHPADATCGNCHPGPTSTTHVNGVVDF